MIVFCLFPLLRELLLYGSGFGLDSNVGTVVLITLTCLGRRMPCLQLRGANCRRGNLSNQLQHWDACRGGPWRVPPAVPVCPPLSPGEHHWIIVLI